MDRVFQRRAATRWGTLGGSALTAALFAGIHLPLAFGGAGGAADVLRNVGVLVVTAIGLRLLIAGLDRWSGGSLLTIGILHGSFNATGSLVDPALDVVRTGFTVLAGVAVFAILVARHETQPALASPAGRRRTERSPLAH